MKVLEFNKTSVVELNNAQLRGTDSGITPLLVGVAIGVGIAYVVDQLDDDQD